MSDRPQPRVLIAPTYQRGRILIREEGWNPNEVLLVTTDSAYSAQKLRGLELTREEVAYADGFPYGHWWPHIELELAARFRP